MGMNLADLPPHMRDQAVKKWQEQQKAKPVQAPMPELPRQNKLHNVPTECKGIKFPSKKEANRYAELMLLFSAGQIRKLKLQVSFTLVEGYTTPEGIRVKPLQYRADFVYEKPINGIWTRIVEDAKGKRTRTFIDKKKQMFEKYGIEVVEV